MEDRAAEPSYDVKSQIRILIEFLKQCKHALQNWSGSTYLWLVAVIWGPALYIFAYMAGPDYDDALFFYFTNQLGFSPTFMGTLRYDRGVDL